MLKFLSNQTALCWSGEKCYRVTKAGNVHVFNQSYHVHWVQPLIVSGRCSLLTFLPLKNGGWILMGRIPVAFYLQAAQWLALLVGWLIKMQCSCY